MRKKRLAWNTISSFLLQIVTIVSGFILPRLIISNYGSEVNGLVNSITQFIGFIAFLELGIGAVVQSALYKPLAEKDDIETSKIIVSGHKFYKTIAKILLLYIIVLAFIYPHIVNQSFGWEYTALLIIIISISSFAQYYFGAVNCLLLGADQHGYIHYLLSAVTLIINTIVSIILLNLNCSIHIVKFASAVCFAIKPILLKIYVDKHYHIDRKIQYDKEPLNQKWNGVAQHVAAIVLDNTDTVVLSLFSTLTNVSIYSVYHLVVYGVKRIFDTTTNGVMSLMGELWAKDEREELKKIFGYSEWVFHTLTVFLFGCVSILICPFISVYTKGISDTNYIEPTFALILTIAHGLHCLRTPYSIMIMAGNHYKQTQSSYIIAAALNLGISIITVHIWGLIGVAIGTLIAMVFHTIWMAIYISKNLVEWPIKSFIKQTIVDLGIFIIAYVLTKRIKLYDITYIQWIIMAIKTAAIWFVICLLINLVFYRNNTISIFTKLIRRKTKG